MANSENSLEKQDLARRVRIDRICEEFERRLKAGDQPHIDDILATADRLELPLLLEDLIALEIEYRRQSESPISSTEYLTRFPDYPEAVNRAFDSQRTESHRAEEQQATVSLQANDGTLDCGVGDIVKSYKILGELGSGGFGTVYEAEQRGAIKRRVALKVIKPGMDTKQVLARFNAEQQTLALMDSAYIAKVFEAGQTDAGRPYFAMELVRGVKITDYCDDHALDIDQRIALFLEVCKGIEHAHERGIIHRDIKPSNVLVEMRNGCANPKVIDFGVAKSLYFKLTEDTVYTEPGQLVGTPTYMSPEQAAPNELGIDLRSDIYSLGVLLFELLTGELPYKNNFKELNLLEMQDCIRSSRPILPSAKVSRSEAIQTTSRNRSVNSKRLTQQLRGDLDRIVMKCLEKEPNRRYESVSLLIADLDKYIKGDRRTRVDWVWLTQRIADRRFLLPTSAGLLIATVLLFALATSEGWWSSRSASPSDGLPTDDEPVASRNGGGNSSASPTMVGDQLTIPWGHGWNLKEMKEATAIHELHLWWSGNRNGNGLISHGHTMFCRVEDDFDNIELADVSQLSYPLNGIDEASLTPGAVFAIRTRTGDFGKLEVIELKDVDNNGSNTLVVRLVMFESDRNNDNETIRNFAESPLAEMSGDRLTLAWSAAWDVQEMRAADRPQTTDLWWTKSAEDSALSSIRLTRFVLIESKAFDDLSRNDIKDLSFPLRTIPESALLPNSVFALRTPRGDLGKFQVEAINEVESGERKLVLRLEMFDTQPDAAAANAN